MESKSKTGRWLRSLVKKSPVKEMPPDTGKFVKAAVHDAIYGGTTIIVKSQIPKTLPLTEATITEWQGAVHVNFGKTGILCRHIKQLDPITKETRLVKRPDIKRRTTSFFRDDGSIDDGSTQYEL